MVAGGLRLPLGGRIGSVEVRGGLGRGKNKPATPSRKRHRAGLYDSALEAAIAFALLRVVLGLGILGERGEKKPQPPASARTSKKADDGVYLCRLMQLPRADVLRVWGAPLSQQHAGALVARGVAVAYADVLL